MTLRLTVIAALLCSAALAQAEPSTQELIDQLKPAPGSTRSLGARRGFKAQGVEAAASQAASASVAASAASRSVETIAVEPPAARPSVSLSIEFDFDSARVRSQSLPVLSNLAQALKSPALKDARFLIEGHTDAAGRADYNQRLSAQRAQAVSSALAAQGVAASRLSAVGKGSSELADAGDPTGAANRRVRIVNLD
jgi:OOP family OmpA-OmpF porin